LQEGEARYRALMDNASDAIVLADSQGNLLEVRRFLEKNLPAKKVE
jgi:PAS domain S-box-containing protein